MTYFGPGWPRENEPADRPTVKVVYDKYCPVDTAYLLDRDMIVMAMRMSRRIWYKPWTWKRHVLSLEEWWGR